MKIDIFTYNIRIENYLSKRFHTRLKFRLGEEERDSEDPFRFIGLNIKNLGELFRELDSYVGGPTSDVCIKNEEKVKVIISGYGDMR